MNPLVAATVIRFPKRFEGLLTKRQLSRIIGRSTRWIELCMRDADLPYVRDRRGWALFDLDEVNRWLADYRAGRVPNR